jgi:hypothetical protein
MAVRRRHFAPIVLVAFGLFAAMVGTILPMLAPGAPEDFLPPRSLIFPILALAVAFTGATILWHRPRDRIGWILALSSIAGSAEHLIAGYAVVSLYGRIVPGGLIAAWIFSWLEVFHLGPLATFALLLFPNGRLTSARWRPVAWVSGAGTFALAAVIAVLPAPIPIFGIPNPFGLAAAREILLPLASGLFALGGICAVASAVSLVARFRSARAVERQQIKWIAYAGLLVPTAIGVIGLLGLPLAIAAVVATLAYTPFPVAMAMAILRYRLYDIDVLINRTVVYGVVSVVLLLTYVVSVIGVQAALRPFIAGSEISVAASTLLVVALFQPLRARVQSGVDRRFYRARYDAVRMVDLFAYRLRDDFDLESVRAVLLGAVGDALRPAHASVWLREAGR